MRVLERLPMVRGTVSAVGANALGELAFIVPDQLSAFPPMEITIGRYLAYGFLSLGLFAWSTGGNVLQFERQIWRTALAFAFIANLAYYFLLVLGVENAGAPATSLIIGALPVTVIIYGNLRHREDSFSRVTVPAVGIFIGLVLLNLPASQGGQSSSGRWSHHVIGVLCALAALILWTWYAVANASFLRSRPQLSAFTWSSLIGVSTLPLALGALGLLTLGGHVRSGSSTLSISSPTDSFISLLIGSLVLGAGASWGAGWLWNKASTMLPMSLAGQLIVCEPLTVLAYAVLGRHYVPNWRETLGATLTISSVLFGVRIARRSPSHG